MYAKKKILSCATCVNFEQCPFAGEKDPEACNKYQDREVEEKTEKCKCCGDLCDSSELTDGVCEWCTKRANAIKEIHNRKAVMIDLSPFDILAKEFDCLEVTEWSNGEGFDVYLCRKDNENTYSFTYGELDAMYQALAKLGYTFEKLIDNENKD